MHRIFSKLGNTLGHEVILNKYKKKTPNIISCILTGQNGIKLEIVSETKESV
jgi:hypothetical protein